MVKKVLMLHGLAQSGPYFESKTKGFRRVLEPLGYEFYYPTAPTKCSPADISTDIDDLGASSADDYHTWIVPDPVNNEYRLPDITRTFLREYILEHGPFDGIIGFSQGAAVAGYLLTDLNHLLDLTEEQQPTLKFCILFMGFRFKPDVYQEQYIKHPIVVPSMHVAGQLDTVVDVAKIHDLHAACVEGTGTYLEHSGGHFVPNSKGFVTKVAEWLQSLPE
ncbi:Family of serine hydrolases 2 [Kluyveromyces marxianus]